MSEKCKAIQHSDQMFCSKCQLVWDMNDCEPPQCEGEVMDNVLKFYTATNTDHILEQAMGDFSDILIIGYDHNGDLDIRANKDLTAKEILWAVETFKAKLINGDYFQ